MCACGFWNIMLIIYCVLQETTATSSLCRKKTNAFRTRWWIVDFVRAMVRMLLLAKIYYLLLSNNYTLVCSMMHHHWWKYLNRFIWITMNAFLMYLSILYICIQCGQHSTFLFSHHKANTGKPQFPTRLPCIVYI